MSDADELRNEVNQTISELQEIQRLLMQVKDKMRSVQGKVIMFDLLHSNSHQVRSAARMAPEIGQQIETDQEIVGQIQSELRQ